MIKIYHVPGTRSVRVIWTAEELGIDYEVIPVDFGAAYRASPEWRRINPVGKVPAMSDGDMMMFESGAMVEYLLARYGAGRLAPPTDSPDYPHYLQWCWFAEATFARPLGEIVNHRRAFGDNAREDAIEEMQARSQLCMKALDDHLDGRDYLLDSGFSAADIMTGYSLLLAYRLAPSDEFPRLAAYWERLQTRPACSKALSA